MAEATNFYVVSGAIGLQQKIDGLEAQQILLQQKLSDVEQFNLCLVDTSVDCIKLLDLDGNITYMSEAGQRVMEVADFEAIRGLAWTGLWQGSGYSEAVAALAEAKAGQTARFQGWANTMAGTRKWWDVRVSPVPGADGRPVKLLSVSRDVTAAQHAEAALREAQVLNTLILTSSLDYIVVLDLAGNTMFVSPGGIESMEITDVDAILGLSWLRVWQNAGDLAAATEAVAQARAGEIGRFEGFCPTHKNTPKWWDVVISPLYGTDGRPDRLVSIGRDITARKMAEQRLADNQERLRAALRVSEAIGTYQWDLPTDLIFADANLCRFYGVDPDAGAKGVLSAEFVAKIHPEDLRTFQRSVNRVLKEKGNYDCVFRAAAPGGPVRWLQANGRVIHTVDGRPTCVAGANVDITEQKLATERLREAEVRMRLAQEVAGIGTFETFVEDDEFVASAQFFRLFGLQPSGREPTSVTTDLILPEDRAKASTGETRRSGLDMRHAQYRIRRADTGEIRWIERQADYWKAGPGGAPRLLGVARDVTNQKLANLRQKAVVELGDQLRTLRSIAEIAETAAKILGRTLDVDRSGYASVLASGHVIAVEPDWCADPSIPSVAGVRDLDLYGSFVADLRRGEVVAVSDIDQDIRTQASVDQLRPLRIKSLLNVPLLKDGNFVALLFIHDVKARVWTDQEIAFLKVVGDRVWVAMEQARVETDLRQLNETLENQTIERTRERDLAWKHSRDLQVVANVEGRLLAANEAWTTILDWYPGDVVGCHYLDFVHPDDHPASKKVLAFAALADLPVYENRYRHRDGSYRWISWVVASEGGLLYGSGRHVTAEKAAAAAMQTVEGQLRQSQKMEAVGQLTAGLAHDFNNLLLIISGNLELLESDLDEGALSEVKRCVAGAQGGVQRAAALTHRLLAFSRQQTLDAKPTDVNRLLAQMQELIRSTIGAAVAVEVVEEVELWTTLVDPNQLENVLLNLAINARDAMPDGGRLTIATANRLVNVRIGDDCNMQPGEYICLSVTDTGTGMTPEVIEHAFDPFYTTKPIGKGTGLGLSMIYGFAQQSGGQAHIHSRLGQGTTISVYLPRYHGLDTAWEAPSPAVAGSVGERDKMALVVDDEPAIRILVMKVLRNLGYGAMEAADGDAAHRVLQSGAKVDLLVTDVALPGGLNGRQLADMARVTRVGLNILFITGYAEKTAIGNGQLPSGMKILVKPFTMKDLAAAVTALVQMQVTLRE